MTRGTDKTAEAKRIGIGVRTLRKQAAMTLDDLSTVAGVSVAYTSQVENGLKRPTDGWVALVSMACAHRIAVNATAGLAPTG